MMTTTRTCTTCAREYPSPASDTTGRCWRCDFDAQFKPVIEQAWERALADLAEAYGLANAAKTAPIHFPGSLFESQVRDWQQRDPGAAKIEYTCIRTAILSVVKATGNETTEAIRRVTGEDVVSISIYDPDLPAKLAAIRRVTATRICQN